MEVLLLICFCAPTAAEACKAGMPKNSAPPFPLAALSRFYGTAKGGSRVSALQSRVQGECTSVQGPGSRVQGECTSNCALVDAQLMRLFFKERLLVPHWDGCTACGCGLAVLGGVSKEGKSCMTHQENLLDFCPPTALYTPVPCYVTLCLLYHPLPVVSPSACRPCCITLCL